MTTAVALADRLMPAVAALRRTVRRHTRERIGVPHLPPGQVELLRAVESDPGTGVAAVARRLHLAENSVSTLVRAAAADGLLHRTADPSDRRVARLELTDAARARLVRWRRTRADVVGHALDRLDESDRTALEAAVPALERLLEAIEQ